MPRATHPLFSAVRNAGAFALALLAVCGAVSSRLPSPRVSGLTEKLDYLAGHRGEIDTVFIGSSRVYGSFIPADFDRDLAARGVPTRSFNFGINGMRPPESHYVLREVLKLGLPLRWVLIELLDFYPMIDPANLRSARIVHWHDARHTWLVLRHIAQSHAPAGNRVTQALTHAGCFLVRLSNVGRGPEWLGPRLRTVKPWRPVLPWDGHAGYGPPVAPVISGERRAKYEKVVAYFGAKGLPLAAVPPLLAEALREVLAEVRAAGAQPIFVISPTVLPRENMVDLAAAGLDAPLIAFTDPQRYPAIFDAANHLDEEHLNPVGAEAYTRALAEEFAALAEK